MNSEISEIIENLRREVIIGGGWASIHSSDLEKIISEIESLYAKLDDAGLTSFCARTG